MRTINLLSSLLLTGQKQKAGTSLVPGNSQLKMAVKALVSQEAIK